MKMELVLSICLSLVACGEARDGAAAGPAGTPRGPVSADGEPRIARRPEPRDSLPAAVLGLAGEPQGYEVAYDSTQPATSGYLAVPEGAGPFPAVLLVHEWNGVVERMRQIADAFAARGYIALAADLFEGRTGTTPEQSASLVREADRAPAGMIGNLDAAIRFIRVRPDATGTVGVIGWSYGGGIALRYAMDGGPHDATAVFYAPLPDDFSRLVDVDHEVYGTFASRDESVPRARVEGFVAALNEAGVRSDVRIYDAVEHGFWLWVDEQSSLRRDPARDAWIRLQAYLERTLR